MRIEVSHESPLQFLDFSCTYNDYDYALVHLFESHPDYYEFFKQNRTNNNRKVYLDNSIFELGESFDSEKYVKWIKELQPTYYIVPDVLESADGTVNKFIDWQELTDNGKTFRATCNDEADDADDSLTGVVEPLKIGVVQGRDWYELTECYRFMSQMADMVAISFDYSYYLFTGTTNVIPPGEGVWYDIMYNPYKASDVNTEADPAVCDMCRDKMYRYKTGRQAFIQRLIDENIWNWNKPHHLLGCSLADEFSYYVKRDIHNIVSVDTSNPIVAAMKGYKYQDTAALQFKPHEKLADLIEFTCSSDEASTIMQTIKYNTDAFKRILGRY